MLRFLPTFRTMALLVALGSATWGFDAQKMHSRSQQAETIQLECQLENGGWQPCEMGISRIGQEWWIEFDNQRIRFEHDGSGQVRMQPTLGADWIPVDSGWAANQVLCWGSVCARGSLPLD
jgi:hypothetical protein